MSQRLRSRVQTRLAALGINPFEADRRAGLARGYVNDLLIGKKASMRPAALGKLAAALDCDPDYLNGVLATPRPGQTPAGTGVAIEGIIEPGVWREPGAELPTRPAPLGPDPRYPADRQHWFIVRGDKSAALGIFDASYVAAVEGIPPREGEMAVIRRRRATGEIETSVRVKTGDTWTAAGTGAAAQEIDDAAAELVGLCVLSLRVFG